MSPTLSGDRARHVALLIRSRSLRRRAEEVLQRAADLRERSARLRGSTDPDADARDEAEALQWYCVQVREMLAAGWSAAELADVGITNALLRELGLAPIAAEQAES
jgi:hypothetical protein